MIAKNYEEMLKMMMEDDDDSGSEITELSYIQSRGVTSHVDQRKPSNNNNSRLQQDDKKSQIGKMSGAGDKGPLILEPPEQSGKPR